MRIIIRKNIHVILIVLISLIFLIPLALPGFLIGHDNIPQLARTASRIIAIQDGQFPVRWAGNLNYGFGHPGFIFFYSLPGYLGAVMHYMGFSLETGYEILLGLAFILSPVFFYIWTSQFLKKNSAFVAAMLYGLAPYSFLNLYVRAHLAEALALMFVPLILFFVEKNNKKITLNNCLFGGLFYVALLHSHSILSFLFTLVLVLYILLKCFHSRKLLIANLSIIGGGLLISAYFWIPALLETKYINSILFLKDWYKDHFLNFSNIVYSQWGFGSNVNKSGGLSAQIGPVQAIFAVLAVFLSFKKSKIRKEVIFWLCIFFGSSFMTLKFSDILWANFHFLQQFQFPWRFIALAVFSSCVLAGYVLDRISKTTLNILVILIVLIISFPMARVWKNDSHNDSYYFNYKGTTAYHNEATTIWVAGDASSFPKNPVEVINGNGSIKELSLKSQKHIYIVDAGDDLRVLDNTTYFPGWKVLIDNKKTPIQFQDQNYRGLITFEVPKGKHLVEVVFGESPIRLISDLISLIALIGVVILMLIGRRFKMLWEKL